MQTVKHIWDALNAGDTVSNGEIEAHYENSVLICYPPSSIIPFNTDNCDEWEVICNTPVQLYCRWYKDYGDTIELTNMFVHIEKEPVGDWKKLNEVFTREEILGLENE